MNPSRPSARATARTSAVRAEPVRGTSEDRRPGRPAPPPWGEVAGLAVQPLRRRRARTGSTSRWRSRRSAGVPGARFRLDDQMVPRAAGTVWHRRAHRPARSRQRAAGWSPTDVGMVPLQPGEPAAVGRRTGRGHEIETGHEHPAGAVRAVERERHQLIAHRRGQVRDRIVRLAHRVHGRAHGVEGQVCVAPWAGRGQGAGWTAPARVDVPQLSIGARRGDHPLPIDRVAAAPVLVDAVADPERGGCQLGGRAVP